MCTRVCTKLRMVVGFHAYSKTEQFTTYIGRTMHTKVRILI